MACSSHLSRIVRRASIGTFLGAFATMLTAAVSSCVLTTNPEFEEPTRTAPFILADRLTPDPRSIIVLQPTDTDLVFTGALRSEDTGDEVEVRLLLDYGTSNPQGTPYLDSINGATVSPSTWDDTDRTFEVPLFLSQFQMAPGCHRFTLMAAHDFRNKGCPAPDDYDSVSYTVIKCDAAGCPDIDGTNPELSCPSLQSSCNTLPSSISP